MSKQQFSLSRLEHMEHESNDGPDEEIVSEELRKLPPGAAATRARQLWRESSNWSLGFLELLIALLEADGDSETAESVRRWHKEAGGGAPMDEA
jgi:hypothetical protein